MVARLAVSGYVTRGQYQNTPNAYESFHRTNLLKVTLGTTAERCAQIPNPLLSHSTMRYSSSLRSLKAFAMTETELKVMAALAIIGLSNNPNSG